MQLAIVTMVGYRISKRGGWRGGGGSGKLLKVLKRTFV